MNGNYVVPAADICLVCTLAKRARLEKISFTEMEWGGGGGGRWSLVMESEKQCR